MTDRPECKVALYCSKEVCAYYSNLDDQAQSFTILVPACRLVRIILSTSFVTDYQNVRTVHKTRCGALELGGCHENLRRLKRFMRMVAGCPPVDQRLSTYISSILDFIALPPDARIPDEPLGVDIEIDVEPTDFSKALELMKAKGDLSDDSDRGPIEGIFQIGFIEPRRELSFDEIRMWKSSRKQCEECGHKNCTSVIIKYRLHGVVMHAFQHVTKEMLKAERQELQDICKRIHAAMKGTLSFTKSDEEGALFKYVC